MRNEYEKEDEVMKSYRLEGKYIYRDICTAILVLITTLDFMHVWYEFVSRHNNTGHLTGIGNILMATIIYAVLYFVIGKWMHAFKIGVERKANILPDVADCQCD